MNVGFIAEEAEDVEVLVLLAQKIVEKRAFRVKRFVGHGCGKLRRKCAAWARVLEKQDCQLLVVAHDADRSVPCEVEKTIRQKLGEAQFRDTLILVPTEELEAWLLCDPVALKKTFSLRKQPKLPKQPERIQSPKEHLRDLVWQEGRKRYVNAIHNPSIARNIDVQQLRSCPSFGRFPEFLLRHLPAGSFPTSNCG